MREEMFEGRNEEEALLKASEVLGVNISEMSYDVLERETGLFGLFGKSVKIRVRVSDEPAQIVYRRPPERQEQSQGVAGDNESDNVPTVPASSIRKGPQARAALDGILQRMGASAEIEVVEDDESVSLNISSARTDLVVGRDGEVLAALQFVVNKIVNRFPEDRKRVVLDASGFRDRREASLGRLALKLAERAVATSKVVRLSPMNARDRRLVHVALKDHQSVSTRSEGEGIHRCLLIVPHNFRERERRGPPGGRSGERQSRTPRQDRGRGRNA